MTHVFTYGTLQLPEVMLAVTGRSFTYQSAILHNFGRYRLRGKSFPGICPEPGSTVKGLVYWEIDGKTLDRLDAFEDDFYHRKTVTITTADGMVVSAEAYVMNPESVGMLLSEEWCIEDFRQGQ